ncbi:MAG TPA: hypothetical protein VEJ87_12115, partial [Acidimicrobiales bacterium]|nr:hypothetical protein [Acidimicrobiales bacterium]
MSAIDQRKPYPQPEQIELRRRLESSPVENVSSEGRQRDGRALTADRRDDELRLPVVDQPDGVGQRFAPWYVANDVLHR